MKNNAFLTSALIMVLPLSGGKLILTGTKKPDMHCKLVEVGKGQMKFFIHILAKSLKKVVLWPKVCLKSSQMLLDGIMC